MRAGIRNRTLFLNLTMLAITDSTSKKSRAAMLAELDAKGFQTCSGRHRTLPPAVAELGEIPPAQAPFTSHTHLPYCCAL